MRPKCRVLAVWLPVFDPVSNMFVPIRTKNNSF